MSSDDETAGDVYRQLVRGAICSRPPTRSRATCTRPRASADDFTALANRLMGQEVRGVRLVQTGVIDLPPHLKEIP